MASKNSRRRGHGTAGGRRIGTARRRSIAARSSPAWAGPARCWRRARGSRPSATRRQPRARARRRSSSRGPRPTSTAACSARSWSISDGPIYTGVYQPGSPLADAKGFRTDVVREVKELGVPIVRYPGGNFVSGYNWLDGVGPKAQRPTVLDRAWNSIESNQFGTNEFIEWCRLVGSGAAARHELRHRQRRRWRWPTSSTATVERGTTWSDLRRAHGYEQPHGVQVLVPRQRDGRPVADRAAPGARVRAQGA